MVPPRLPRCATCGLGSERRSRGADHGPDQQECSLDTRSSTRSPPQSLLAKPYLLPKYVGGEARSTAEARLQKVGSPELPLPPYPDDPRTKDGWLLWGMKTRSRDQGRAAGIGSVKRPSPGFGAMGEMRR